MKNQYHVLNGDVLKNKFPNQISGEVIIARECLVDGPVDGESLDELFETRSTFIAENYEGFQQEDYHQNSVPEFRKIQNIPPGSEINLWFEDDLFCQVNLWFVCSLLNESPDNNSVYLIRPEEHTPNGFGGLSEDELRSIFKKRTRLVCVAKLAELWELYRSGKADEMLRIGNELENKFPFLLLAIQAHIDRIPSDDNPGRLVQSLVEISEELKTDDFESIFREFNKRESIYGFGDLQVKRLLDRLRSGN